MARQAATPTKPASSVRLPGHAFLVMASPPPLLFSLLLLLRLDPSAGGPVAAGFVYPNFTASNLLYVDSSGVFLESPAATFHAVIDSPGPQQPGNFYFSIVHVSTNTIVWSANRATPVPDSGELLLSPAGLALFFPSGSPAWSTPALDGPVSAMRLADTGNLLLLDRNNATLWQSFDYPTDTLLSGQALPVGAELVSATSDSNLTEGDYRLVVTGGDAELLWNKGDQQYWSFSTDARTTKDTNAAASYLAMNSTGFYLFGGGGKQVVWRTTTLPTAGLHIGKLDYKGRFAILSYVLPNATEHIDDEFVAPASDCDLPLSCRALGLCTLGQNTSCSCPPGFGSGDVGCQPDDGSILASTSACTESPSYVSFPKEIDYFTNKFARPTVSNRDLSGCQSLCSLNCSCLGFYYRNSTGSCFFLESQLGSFRVRTSVTASSDMGFMKVVPPSSPAPKKGNWAANVLPILLPSVSVLLLLVLLVVIFSRWRRRRRRLKKSSRYSAKNIKLGRHKSWASTRSDEEDEEDEDEISIPGLPTRFSYEELVAATEGFRTRIGSGGFGEVYKGVLPDKTTVAVKRIMNIGVQGKREFCTEIAVIGNIHHINLVKLRGFCMQGSKRLLVYEFMNRGSLDRPLFAAVGAPVLEWGERVEIALGTARGLAYLHGGCDHKIIHCDVKPENILLNDQSQVKISDFGLSKLLAPEQSALFTTMRGTRGYLAPEWLTNSAISNRTDVYSYGMVLLEIVRGRKNCVVVGPTDDSELVAAAGFSGGGASALSGSSSSAALARVYFPMHALEMHEQGRYLELADPRLEGRVEAAEVEKVVRVALCCLHEEPALRPSMAAVVGMLEGTVPVWAPRSESLSFLRFYGRGFEARPDAMMMAAVGHGTAAAAVGQAGFYGRGKNAASMGSTTSTSQSCMSAHQLSGPR